MLGTILFSILTGHLVRHVQQTAVSREDFTWTCRITTGILIPIHLIAVSLLNLLFKNRNYSRLGYPQRGLINISVIDLVPHDLKRVKLSYNYNYNLFIFK